MNKLFDPEALAKIDLSRWTPVATRQRAWLPEAGARRWTTIEGSPLSEPAARLGRMAGYLLTALRCDQDTETLLVQLTDRAKEAMAAPVPTPTRPRRSSHRRWWDGTR